MVYIHIIGTQEPAGASRQSGAESDMRCTCCNKPIKTEVVWLELDQRNGSYHDRGDIPGDKNQGGFPFGKICAKKLKKAAA